MPIVLDYDSDGNIVGGHLDVEEQIRKEDWDRSANENQPRIPLDQLYYHHSLPPNAPTDFRNVQPRPQMLLQEPIWQDAQQSVNQVPMQMAPMMMKNDMLAPLTDTLTVNAQYAHAPFQQLPQSSIVHVPQVSQEDLQPQVPNIAAAVARHAFGHEPVEWMLGAASHRYADEEETDRLQMVENEPSHPAQTAYTLCHSHPNNPSVMAKSPPTSPPVINLASKSAKKVAKSSKAASKAPSAIPKATSSTKNTKRKRESSVGVSKAVPKSRRQAKAPVSRRKSSKASKDSAPLTCDALVPLPESEHIPASNSDVVIDFSPSPNAAKILSGRSDTHGHIAGVPLSAAFTTPNLPSAPNEGLDSDAEASAAITHGNARQREWLATQSVLAWEGPDVESDTQAQRPNQNEYDTTVALQVTPIAMSAGLQVETRVNGFVTYFNEYFGNNYAVLGFVAALCRAFTSKVLSEADFYVGMYRLLKNTDSLDLVAKFKEVLPGSWKYVDLGRLDQEVEKDIQSKLAATGSAEDLLNSLSDKKAKKKVPVNGFRAGEVETPGCKIRVKGRAYDTCSEDQTSEIIGIPQAQQSLIVKLQIPNLKEKLEYPSSKEKVQTPRLKKRITKSTSSVTPQKRKAIGSAQKPTVSNSSSSKQSRKSYGLSLGSEVPHVGPLYPTRRAVLVRSDKPYICHLCGASYTHPQDVSNHFGGVNTSKSGCWERKGKPKGDAANWDRHGSCRVGYQDINYTKVLDGYVILDQESWDKLEAACAAGMRFKKENGDMVDAVGETDEESGPAGSLGSNMSATLQKATPQRKVVKAGEDGV